jgi:hypothetical protein
MTAPLRVFIGWDPRETVAWTVARASLGATTASQAIDVRRINMSELVARGLYTRPTLGWPERKEPGYWDAISDAPMATGHAIARFLVPALCAYTGFALFTDGDVLFREDLGHLFAMANPEHAVSVVQHTHVPTSATKMDGQTQTIYPRKNWSSVMLFNCAHPANRALTVDLVNTVPGRDLHRFCWLPETAIGRLPARWNYLVGSSTDQSDPAIVHFTNGVPNMPGYEHCAFSDEWFFYAQRSGLSVRRPPKPSRCEEALAIIETLAVHLQAIPDVPPDVLAETQPATDAMARHALTFVRETRAELAAASS